MSEQISNFIIVLIEPGEINSEPLSKLLRDNQLFELIHLSEWVETHNYIRESNNSLPDVVVVNSDIKGTNTLGISIEKIITAVFMRSDWEYIPKILVIDKLNSKLTSFLKKMEFDCILNTPVKEDMFFDSIFSLMVVGLDRHTNKVNQQHIDIAKGLKELSDMVKNKANAYNIRLKFEKISEKVYLHFKFEEDYMQRHDFDEFIEHKKNHQLLLTTIANTIDNLSKISNSKILEILTKLRSDIYGDINDDQSYIEFLENIHKRINVEINKK